MQFVPFISQITYPPIIYHYPNQKYPLQYLTQVPSGPNLVCLAECLINEDCPDTDYCDPNTRTCTDACNLDGKKYGQTKSDTIHYALYSGNLGSKPIINSEVSPSQFAGERRSAGPR